MTLLSNVRSNLPTILAFAWLVLCAGGITIGVVLNAPLPVLTFATAMCLAVLHCIVLVD